MKGGRSSKMKKNWLLKKIARSNKKGFTLIEIIAVLVILGILAAVAIPKYTDLQNTARIKAAQSAVAEVKARCSSVYSQWLMVKNGAQPSMGDITAGDGTSVPPIIGVGTTPDLGDDYDVTFADGLITVTAVQGVALEPAVTGTWVLPAL